MWLNVTHFDKQCLSLDRFPGTEAVEMGRQPGLCVSHSALHYGKLELYMNLSLYWVIRNLILNVI